MHELTNAISRVEPYVAACAQTKYKCAITHSLYAKRGSGPPVLFEEGFDFFEELIARGHDREHIAVRQRKSTVFCTPCQTAR